MSLFIPIIHIILYSIRTDACISFKWMCIGSLICRQSFSSTGRICVLSILYTAPVYVWCLHLALKTLYTVQYNFLTCSRNNGIEYWEWLDGIGTGMCFIHAPATVDGRTKYVLCNFTWHCMCLLFTEMSHAWYGFSLAILSILFQHK